MLPARHDDDDDDLITVMKLQQVLLFLCLAVYSHNIRVCCGAEWARRFRKLFRCKMRASV